MRKWKRYDRDVELTQLEVANQESLHEALKQEQSVNRQEITGK